MADPTRLSGSNQAQSLGEGYALRAPGMHGTAELFRRRSAEGRAVPRSNEVQKDELDTALRSENITEIRQIDVVLERQPGPGRARGVRASEGTGMMELQVPDLGPETGQLVLGCDETGVLRWHLPVDEDGVQPPGRRGTGGVKRFLIPATSLPEASEEDAGRRGLIGAIGKKLLKVLVYPVVDPVIGAVGEFFARKWEEKKRPYGLRDYTPDDRREPGGRPLGQGDWGRLSQGRSLLFVHGTFSTAHSGFSQIPDDVFESLYRHYEGRVFAFDHHTMSSDPAANVRWMMDHVPDGTNLEVDIICHSRGGLVSRTLAEKPSVFGLDTAAVDVSRLVFVGVPNSGTLLTRPDHIMQMIDRLTTVINLFPSGLVVEVLEAIITVVKVLSHGLLSGLDGLTAMNPEGDFLATLNRGRPSSGEYFGIAADYEPEHAGLKALIAGTAADSVMDMVFEDAANDLVVPELGVYGKNESELFPLPKSHLLQIPADKGVVHTQMFAHRDISAKLSTWLRA